MKYILNEKIGLTFNASSKARDDIAYFVGNYKDEYGNNYSVIGNNDKTNVKTRVGKVWLGIMSLLILFIKIHKNDVLFVQSSLIVLKRINLIKKIKKFKVIYLIHDLDAIRDRYDDQNAVNEAINVLNCEDVIICHNDSMLTELESRKCTTKIVTLEIFDYYIEGDMYTNKLTERLSICFAGNLSPLKTGFLYQLDSQNITYELRVYGKKEKEFNNLQYIGCFKPEELPQNLQGNYGLIWEGNETEYDETEHPYIMFNNPHKASLYIVSGLPIIIWEKAALAPFIIKNGIGLTVSSLSELERKVANIDTEKYNQMIENIEKIRLSLVNGEHVHNALRNAESYI